MVDKEHAEKVVEALFEDIDKSVMLGSALYCLSDSQKANLRKRWVAIVQRMQVPSEPAYA